MSKPFGPEEMNKIFNPEYLDAVRGAYADIVKKLTEPQDTEKERPLIECVALYELMNLQIELAYPTKCDPKDFAWWDNMISETQKRYFSACVRLATARRRAAIKRGLSC